jgi:hypothetical protein
MSCVGSLLEAEMPKGNLASMSVDALLKLRDDIEKVLGRKANELKHQLSRLGDEIGSSKLGRRSFAEAVQRPTMHFRTDAMQINAR